jgi:hypothetical protein
VAVLAVGSSSNREKPLKTLFSRFIGAFRRFSRPSRFENRPMNQRFHAFRAVERG